MEKSVREILNEHGIEVVKHVGGEYVVWCTCGGHEPKLYINPNTGAWVCFRCGEHGGIKALIKHLTGRCVEENSRMIPANDIVKIPCCSVERRDEVFRQMSLPLSDEHRRMLYARGFRHIPHDYKECGSAFVSGTTKGVPGFVDGHLVPLSKGFMIPYFNKNELIQSFQIRSDDGPTKYYWLSARKFGGAGGSFAHYACDFRKTGNGRVADVSRFFCRGLRTIAVTEGALKADLFHQLSGGVPTIALPGVQSSKLLEKEFRFLKQAGVKQIVNLFDMDYITNKQVKRASDKLERIIRKHFEYFRPTWDDNYKGIDDYYHHLIDEEGKKVIGFMFEDGTSVFNEKLTAVSR